MTVGYVQYGAPVYAGWPEAAAVTLEQAEPLYPFAYGMAAGATIAFGPATYGVYEPVGGYSRFMPGGMFGWREPIDATIARGAVAAGSLAFSSSPAGVAAMRVWNDANGYRSERITPGAGGATPPSPSQTLDRLVGTVLVDGKNPSAAFSTDERKAIRDAEKGSPFEGRHKMLTDLVGGVKGWIDNADNRGRFLLADDKLHDGNPPPSKEDVYKRRFMNLIDAGAIEPNSRLNTAISDILGRKHTPREKGDSAYIEELVKYIDQLGLRGEVERLYSYALQRANELGADRPATPGAADIANAMRGMGYDTNTATAAAAKLAKLSPMEWDDARQKLLDGAKEAGKLTGKEAKQERLFTTAATEVLKAMGFRDSGEKGQLNDVYALAVVMKGRGRNKVYDYHNFAGFITRAEKIKGVLAAGKTTAQVKQQFGNGKG